MRFQIISFADSSTGWVRRVALKRIHMVNGSTSHLHETLVRDAADPSSVLTFDSQMAAIEWVKRYGQSNSSVEGPWEM